MKFYVLQPEVAGGFGPNSVIDPSKRPPIVTKFNYEFDGWLGDPILETVGCFIVTKAIGDMIGAIGASGVSLGHVEISKSAEWQDVYGDLQLPPFVWLQVNGKPGLDDFGLDPTHCLVVSQRIYEILRSEGMTNCNVAEFRT
jgi:hypothetical protein